MIVSMTIDGKEYYDASSIVEEAANTIIADLKAERDRLARELEEVKAGGVDPTYSDGRQVDLMRAKSVSELVSKLKADLAASELARREAVEWMENYAKEIEENSYSGYTIEYCFRDLQIARKGAVERCIEHFKKSAALAQPAAQVQGAERLSELEQLKERLLRIQFLAADKDLIGSKLSDPATKFSLLRQIAEIAAQPQEPQPTIRRCPECGSTNPFTPCKPAPAEAREGEGK